MRIARSVIPLTLLAVGALTACESPQQAITEHEDHLAAAGFVDRPANTPQRVAMMQRLPSHRFLRRVKGDVVHYVYADPTVCGCLYVGDQTAYARYRQYQQQQNLADEQQMAAADYSDASWNWGMWGPGFGPGFGPFGPGWGPGW